LRTLQPQSKCPTFTCKMPSSIKVINSEIHHALCPGVKLDCEKLDENFLIHQPY
jgi:hypothetical protein